MTDPELMLLDEPAAGLDLGGREDLVAPARQPRRRHRGAGAGAGHPPRRGDPARASPTCCCMREGRIVAAGPVEITLTAENLSRDLRPAARRRAARRAAGRRGPNARRRPEGTRRERHAAFTAVRGRSTGTCRSRSAGRGAVTWFGITAGWPGWGSRSPSAPSRRPPSTSSSSCWPAARWRVRSPRPSVPPSRPRCSSRWPWRRSALLARAPVAQAPVHASRTPRASAAASPDRPLRLVLSTVTEHGGRVKLGGETWSARTAPDDRACRRRARRSGSSSIEGPRRSSSGVAGSSSGNRTVHRASDPGVETQGQCVVLLAARHLRRRRASSAPCGSCRSRPRRSSSGSAATPTLDGGHPLPRPVRRQGARQHRPARAGRHLPAAAGDHVRQPRRQHRHGHLLLGHRRQGGGLRDRQLHPGHRAAHRHHAAQRHRLARPRADADQPRPDQRPAARRPRRGHRQVGHPRQPRRAQGHRPAALGPGLDGEADARRA